MNIDHDDLDIDIALNEKETSQISINENITNTSEIDDTVDTFIRMSISRQPKEVETGDAENMNVYIHEHSMRLPMDNDFPLWATDSSTRRSPEGLY